MVRVWDLPTRLFHWGLVGMIALTWASSEAEGRIFWIHVYLGTGVLGFVVWRLLWGVMGSRYAQFRNFVRGPDTVKAYAKNLLALNPKHFTGHNPVGGWMILALLAILTLTIFTGLMSREDDFVGPLAHVMGARFLGETHEGLANLLLTLIVVHVAGVILHGWVSNENLVRAMWTGFKAKRGAENVPSIRPVGLVRPILALAAGLASVVYFLR